MGLLYLTHKFLEIPKNKINTLAEKNGQRTKTG